MDFYGEIIIIKKKKKTNLEKYPPVCFGAAVLAGGEKCFLLTFPPGSESSPPVFGGCCWESESASPLHTLTHTQRQRMLETLSFRGGWWVEDGIFSCVFVCLCLCKQFPKTALTTDSNTPVWPLIRRFCSIQICPRALATFLPKLMTDRTPADAT